MSKLKAILFDIDGTLLDTLEFIYQAFEYAFKQSNLLPPARAELALILGNNLPDCYGHFYPQADLDQLCRDHRIFQLNNLQLSIPFPNLFCWLWKN